MSIALPSPEEIERYGGERGRVLSLEKAADVTDRVRALQEEDFSELTRWMLIRAEKGIQFASRTGIYGKPVADSGQHEATLVVHYIANDPTQHKKLRRSELHRLATESLDLVTRSLAGKLPGNIVGVASNDLPQWARASLKVLKSGSGEQENASLVSLPGGVDFHALVQQSQSFERVDRLLRRGESEDREKAAMVVRVAARVRGELERKVRGEP